MLHQVADSPIIRHDVFDVGPSTPYFSLPMTMLLGVFDGSVDRLSRRSLEVLDLIVLLSSPQQPLQ